jgi:hypothetical protein
VKYLFLFFCLILCSCEDPELNGTCVPIEEELLKFNSQGGIDSISPYYYWRMSFTGIFTAGVGEEECEVKPDTVECLWFSLVKRDSAVFASVNQNNTGRIRDVSIKIWEKGDKCDMWGAITIIQYPEPIELSKDEF